MIDRYQNFAAGLESPALHGFAVTPDDGTDLSETTRALYVGNGGDVVVILLSGAELTFANVASGTVLPLRTRRVKASGTTADAIVGLV